MTDIDQQINQIEARIHEARRLVFMLEVERQSLLEQRAGVAVGDIVIVRTRNDSEEVKAEVVEVLAWGSSKPHLKVHLPKKAGGFSKNVRFIRAPYWRHMGLGK